MPSVCVPRELLFVTSSWSYCTSKISISPQGPAVSVSVFLIKWDWTLGFMHNKDTIIRYVHWEGLSTCWTGIASNGLYHFSGPVVGRLISLVLY